MGKKVRVMTETNGQEFANELKKYVAGKTVSPEEMGNTLADYDTSEEVDEKLAGFFDTVEYDKASKKIIFKKGEEKKGEVDAADFIKDGQVNAVEITSGTNDNQGKQVLKVTFNTDAGLEPIEIPLENIFNPDNYMTKTQTEQELGKKLDTSTYNEEKEDFLTDEDIEPVSSETIKSWFA